MDAGGYPSKKRALGSPLDLAKLVGNEGEAVRPLLLASGLPTEAITEKSNMLSLAAKRLVNEGLDQTKRARAYWVPGRVEVSGKHTDYAGGRSLLAATNKGFAVVSVDRDDDSCRIFTTFGLSREQKAATLRVSKDLEPELGHWTAYPATAIRRLAKNFGISLGVDVAIECDLPEASGMSTSSAVICYMWMVLADRNGIREMARFKEELATDEELYSYLGFIENGQDCGTVLVGDKGVGTFGGSEDHTAIMSSETRKLKVFSYCPTKHEHTFDFPSEVAFVIAVSGALAEKTGDAMADYNNAAFLARDGALAWCDAIGRLPLGGETFVPGRANLAEVIRDIRANGGGDDAAVRAAIGETIAKVDDGSRYGPGGRVTGDASAAACTTLYKCGALRERAEQFFDESEVLTLGIARAIADKDYKALGQFADESHRQTVERLRNTVPETAWLPQEARRLGALGASAFGAGFGGSCWAIVECSKVEAFMASWKAAYIEKFPHATGKCKFFAMTPGPGAFAL